MDNLTIGNEEYLKDYTDKFWIGKGNKKIIIEDTKDKICNTKL
jgi:hypothetical protein